MNTRFTRYARKEDISDDELRKAVNRLEAEQADANLGGNVYKLRVARPNEGKSGGHRVIVLFRCGDKTFYVYGFAKSERSDINEKELRRYKKLANNYFLMTVEQLEAMIKDGQLIEL